MAHRIYIYNIDLQSKESYPNYLAEWNYVIPDLLLPLFSINLKAKGKRIYADKMQGIVALRSFFNLLADSYQLHYKKEYFEPVNKMFEFLESLPFDSFMIDGSDVFTMNEEKPSEQAKSWVNEILSKAQIYNQAINNEDLNVLNEILRVSGYSSFLEILQTDWINFGLGYWNEDLYKFNIVEIFEEHNFMGLKNSKGIIIVPPIYEQIYAFFDGIAVVQKNNKYGYLNTYGELLADCLYDDAFDIFEMFYEDLNNSNDYLSIKVGLVHVNSKIGLLAVEKKHLQIPCEYDELDQLFSNYFNAKTANGYQLIDHENRLIISEFSQEPWNWENNTLFFKTTNGTSKRSFYNHNGIYLGDFVEDVLNILPNGFYYATPNKFQTKIQIINSDGQIFKDNIDQIITLDNYNSFCYKINKKWFLYDTISQTNLLENTCITEIKIDYFHNYFDDVYIMNTDNGWGIYNAKKKLWLIEPTKSISKIQYITHDFFEIESTTKTQFFDCVTNQISNLYDYISEAIESTEAYLMLYDGDTVFELDLNKTIVNVLPETLGKRNAMRYNLRGKDLQYFNLFFDKLYKKLGAKIYECFDNDTLYNTGINLIKEENIQDAITVFSIGLKRNHPEMITELGYIYENEGDFQDLNKAFSMYQKSCDLNEKSGCNNLGYFYQNGIVVKQDTSKAIKYYEKAAALDSGLGYGNLGSLYFYGEQVAQDYDKALYYFLEAEKRYFIYSKEICEIYYSRQEFNKVLPLLKRDYSEEFSPIYFGIMYDLGLGNLKQNINKAIAYYEKAMQIGCYHHAVQRLLFYYGENENTKNETRYQEWLAFAKLENIDLE